MTDSPAATTIAAAVADAVASTVMPPTEQGGRGVIEERVIQSNQNLCVSWTVNCI